MSTNFPLSLDTLGATGTIGGPFVDAAPPVDLFVDIAADFRSNLNDAMLAVQDRVGLTNDTNSRSLSWATISEGAVNNLGLRFAADQTEWPGVVGESGIFLKDGTFEPMFHRAGEAKTTFHSMLGGGGGGTLQDAYNTSGAPAKISLSAGKSLVFVTEAVSGNFMIINEAETEYFLHADESAGLLTLGSGTVHTLNLSGRISSDIQFDPSASRNITLNSNTLTIQTVGTGDLKLLAADNIVIRPNGVGGEEMLLLTGSDDPTSVAKWAYRGSLYLRDSGAVGELYVKQDNASTTNWTLLGTGGGGTLQDAYDAGNTIVTTGVGSDFSISGTEDFIFDNDATSRFVIGTSGTSYTSLSPLFSVAQNVGIDGTKTIYGNATNLVGNNGREFGVYTAEVRDFSDLDSDDVIYGYACDLNMSGNGPIGTPVAVGTAFYARSSVFGGTNLYVTSGLLVDQGFNYSIFSQTGNAMFVHHTDSETFDITPDTSLISVGGMNSDMVRITLSAKSSSATGIKVGGSLGPTNAGGSGSGGVNFESEYSTSGWPGAFLLNANYYLYKAVGETHLDDAGSAWEYGYYTDFTIPSSGGPAIADVGCGITGVYANVPESYDFAGGVYHNNDGYYTFGRWAVYVEQGESHFRRTEFEGPTGLNKPLIRMRQADEVKAFYEVHGGHDPDPVTPAGNLCTTNVGASIVGPLDGTWSYIGMYQVYVTDSNGVIPNGHYWVPLYRAI